MADKAFVNFCSKSTCTKVLVVLKDIMKPIHLKFEFFTLCEKLTKSAKFSHLLQIFPTFCEICCEKIRKKV